MRSLYDVLGVAPDASQEEVRAAYRRHARDLHPDINSDPYAADAMRLLNEAWRVLSDPGRRARYDDRLLADPVEEAFREAEEEGEGVHRPGGRGSLAPLLVLVAILLVIFVITAYAGAPAAVD